MSYFITGANRGLGLEMVNQLLAKYNPSHIFATYRSESNSKELFDLSERESRVHPLKMDVTDTTTFPAAIDMVRRTLGDGKRIDFLINNAGFYSKDSQDLSSISKQTILDYLEVNTFPTLFVTRAFLPLLEKREGTEGHSVVVNLASRLASLQDNRSGSFYASRCSRAGQNAIIKSLAIDLLDRGIIVVGVNPGWVKTDQGGSDAPLEKEKSVAGILSVISSLKDSQAGLILQWDGQIVPY